MQKSHYGLSLDVLALDPAVVTWWSDTSPPRGLASSLMGKWTPILTTNLKINLLQNSMAFSATDSFETFSVRVWGWKLNDWKFEIWEPSLRASHKEIPIYQSIWEVARQNHEWLFPIWKASTQHCSHSILKLLARTCQNRWCTCLLWPSIKQKKESSRCPPFLVINYILFLAKFFEQTIPDAMRNQ